MSKRAVFLTIGQSPRDDMMEEMRTYWGSLQVEQRGVLDDVDPEEIETRRPAEDEKGLVSRLRDGTEVLLSASWVHERVEGLVEHLSEKDFDFLVLLCTGAFPGLRPKRLLLKAGSIVDHGIAAFAEAGSSIGVLVPHESQMKGLTCGAAPGSRFLLSHASPYSGDLWEESARKLERADVIVLHCMGYTESMRKRMEGATGKPVLLARRMVAAAVAQLL